jgi:hypothetical protein
MPNTWWLILGAAVVVVAAVAIVVATRQPKRATKPAGVMPGEIWWADVPYEDGTGAKIRPCLVLRTTKGRIEVLKITSQDQSDRRDHIEIPTKSWDKRATHNSYLDLSDPITVKAKAFERKAGTIDSKTWSLVRKLHAIR